jgi:NADH-quinone oxidoreductase subunit N
LLAYSGVAHTGYILAALLGGLDGVPAMWFYVATYAFMVIGGFTIVSVVSGPGSTSSPIESVRGLARRSPELGWLLAILMFGMSGMPFFAGFVGKILAFVSADSAGYLWVVIIGTLTTVIGFAFYFKVVAIIFAKQESDEEPINVSLQSRLAIYAAVVVTVVLGIYPWGLLDIVRDALPL